MIKTMCWVDYKLILLDQRKLPLEVSFYTCHCWRDVVIAIKELIVRGAPAIGAAAAYGMALAAMNCRQQDIEICLKELSWASQGLMGARPTAVNLFWAIERINQLISPEKTSQNIFDDILAEAHLILQEDILMNRQMGAHGAKLITHHSNILTHCNAGSYATGGYGTALGVIRAAHAQGKVKNVFVDETRPLFQGARITAFELMEEGIPVTLITDSMAAYVMQKGLVDLVLVGADRITRQGDVANKIGTYGLAVLTNYHQIPFYVAAPSSTFDGLLETGKEIPIEERNPQEVREFSGQQVAPENVPVLNPAFDVTPHNLITAIITEKGIIHQPNGKSVKKIFDKPIREGDQV